MVNQNGAPNTNQTPVRTMTAVCLLSETASSCHSISTASDLDEEGLLLQSRQEAPQPATRASAPDLLGGPDPELVSLLLS